MAATRFLRRMLPPALALLALAAACTGTARAQAIAVVVNGDPITTTEVDEQLRYRRLTRLSGDRGAALEDLVADRIKLRAANRAGLDATDAGFAQALNTEAKRAGTSSQALLAEIQRSRLNADLVRSHLRALAAWNDLVKSRYKALAVSQAEIDAAIAKNASLSRSDTDYTLQQIVFVVPLKASPGVAEERMREAQALRGRFQDCASGVPLARALPDVAVKPPFVKQANALSEATRKELETVQRGRLTPPQRTAAGVEMIAVCSKQDDNNQTSVRDGVEAQLLVERLAKEADRMYAELRSRAVVEKR